MKIYGHTELAEVLNRTKQLISVQLIRGNIEQPTIKVGKRAYWSEEQVLRILEQYKGYKLKKDSVKEN